MSKTYKGSCHYGFVKFEIDSPLDEVRSCDCSICIRAGALIQRVDEAHLRLLAPSRQSLDDGTSGLIVYQFNSKIAKHYYCSTCGILPFRRPRTAPEVWAVNIRCLEGINLDKLTVTKSFGSKYSVVEKYGACI